MNLFKPFISSKFWKKLHYVNEMKELYSFMDPQQIQLSINLLPGEMIASRPEIFGVGLSEVMEHPMNRDSPCPLIVLNCLRYLKKNGTETEGIFRLSGRAQRIEELKQAYNRGEVTDLSNEADVHVIAGLLKSYFRELPDPLCCHHLYPEWIAAYDPNDLENTKRNIAKILKKLPQTNLLTLSLLMGLLAEILVNSAITKMTASNLAICWAPNIIKPLQDSLTSALNDTNYITSIVSLFILHYEEFFPSRGVIEDAVEDTTAPTPAPAPAPLSLTRSDGAV
uniref:Rho-GAP domain-containing protein n=1 Tax=Arcella intermedia TaxID=1963864 RepID=A0A6B2LCK7_9EUKA